MSINWNHEIKMKDIKKFFHQEINTNVDVNKVAQTVAMIAIFGIMPAFTYGTVLGSLEEQRVALMAQVQTAVRSYANTTQATDVIYNARMATSTYAFSSTTLPVKVYFGSATSTGPVTFTLFNSSGNSLGVVGTSTSVSVGPNSKILTIPSSLFGTSILFYIRVTHVPTQRTSTTGQFQVMGSVIINNPSISINVVDNGVKSPVAATINIGFSFANFGNKDLYISKSTNITFATSSTVYSRLHTESVVPANLAGDTSSMYVIPSGTARSFSVSGNMQNLDQPTGLHEFKVLRIIYSDDSKIPARNAIETPTLRGSVILDPVRIDTKVVVRLSPSSPQRRIVVTSTDTITRDVVLGIFDFRSQNISSTLHTLIFTPEDTRDHIATSAVQMYRNMRLYDGDMVYRVNLTPGGSLTASNLSIEMPQDTWKSLVLKVDVENQNGSISGVTASTSIVVDQRHILGTDVNNNPIKLDNFSPITANEITFQRLGAIITDTSASYNIIDNGSNASVSASVKMGFAFNNAGTKDLYISKFPGLAFAASSTIKSTASSTLTLISTISGTASGDTKTAYIIPAGTSRAFSVSGIINNKNGRQGVQEFKITKIYFADDTTNLQEFNIDFGLEALRVNPFI